MYGVNFIARLTEIHEWFTEIHHFHSFLTDRQRRNGHVCFSSDDFADHS